MTGLEIFLIYGAYKVVKAVAESLSESGSAKTNTPAPEKLITFVGATNAGKSSTLNALLGYAAFPTSQAHGTTQAILEKDFISGYKLRDTPGIMDSADYSSIIWSAIRISELVIFTTTEELYRPELEMVQQISQRQKQWDIESGTIGRRVLALYVNKQDVKDVTLTNKERTEEVVTIQKQVSLWISAERIVFGSAAPVKERKKQEPQISALKALILTHISTATNKL